ncbi:hypothetical protein HYT57_01610 [Candidatus Woesearchaeota archaeon]|nr:hypothetical protein [Candidatus Woesearchaeota archaeon]
MWNLFKSKKEQRASAFVKKSFNLNSTQGRSLLTNSINLLVEVSMLYERNVDVSKVEKELIKNLNIFLAEKVTHNTLSKKGERRRLSQELQSLKSIAYKAK